MAETIEQLIRRIAAEEGVDQDLAVAMARQESSLNPRAVGDNGDSVGLFQLNRNGMGAGMGDARYDPETNARVALRSLAATIRANPNRDPGTLAAMSQRPYDAAGYARSINAMLSGGRGLPHTGSPFDPNGGAPVATNTNEITQREAEVSRLEEEARIARANAQAARESAATLRDSSVTSSYDPEEAAKRDKQAEKFEADAKSLERQLATARTALGKAKDTAGRPTSGQAASPYINADSGDPVLIKRGPDGQPLRNADGTLATEPNPAYRPPAAPRPEKPTITHVDLGNAVAIFEDGKEVQRIPKSRDFKTANDPQGNVWLMNPDGSPARQLWAAKPGTFTSGNHVFPLDPATGLPKTDAGVELPRDPQVIQRDGRAVGIDPATGKQVYTTDTLTPAERARADEAATLDLEAKRRANLPKFDSYGTPQSTYNAAVERAKGIAAAKLADYQRAIDADPGNADKTRREMRDWWQQNVAAPLAGLRSAAEEANAQLQAQNEAAQRAEDQRVETANREREKFAYDEGQKLVGAAAAVIPNIRSAAFLQNMAQAANAFQGKGPAPTWDASTFQPDAGQIPGMDQMAQLGAARALAHISPTAARVVGRPLPALYSMPEQDITAMIPAYGAGSAGNAAAAGS